MIGNLNDYYDYTAPLGGDSGFILNKRFNCFLYQCYEGKVPESELYRFVREVHYTMCKDFLSTLEDDFGDFSQYWN